MEGAGGAAVGAKIELIFILAAVIIAAEKNEKAEATAAGR